jgi:TonB family protein
LHRSVFVSVLIHFAVFLLWPEVQNPAELRGGLRGSGLVEVVTLAIQDLPSSGGAAPPAEAPEGEEADAENEALDAGGPESAPAGWEHLPTNLWRLAALTPQLADSTPQREERSGDADADSSDPTPDGTESDSLRIRLEAAELDLQRLSEEERLSLERLSAYRPQLVLASPTSWLVVRNPDEVGAFMDARLPSAGPDRRGLIGVAIWVDELGSVEWADVVQSSGDASVDESALEMFRTVVSFRPARENGSRVSVAALYWVLW